MESIEDIEVFMSIKDLSLTLQEWVRLPHVGQLLLGRASDSLNSRQKIKDAAEHRSCHQRCVYFDYPQAVRLDQVISLPSTASPNA